MNKKDIQKYKKLFTGKQFQKAKELIEKKMEEGCVEARTLFYLADCEYELKNYENAKQKYTKVIKLKKEMDFISNAYYNRGLCKAELEQYNDAIVDFTKAQGMGEHADYLIAEMYTKLEKFNKAYGHINKWNLSNPNDGKGWVYTGIIQNALDKHKDALYAFYKAFELGEKDKYVIDGIITESNWLDEIIDMINFVLANKDFLTVQLSEKIIDIIEDYNTSGGEIPMPLQKKINFWKNNGVNRV